MISSSGGLSTPRRTKPLHTAIGIRLLTAWLLLLPAVPGWPAEISARVSGSQPSAQQPFQLVLEIRGEVDGPPDLSVLQPDFEILGRRKSQNVRVVNGTVSRRATLILTLMPRSTGRLVIPAVPFGKDRSNPVTLEVPETVGWGPQEAYQDLYTPPVTAAPPFSRSGTGPAVPPVYSQPPSRAAEPGVVTAAGNGTFWPWVALFLAFGWFFTLAVWWASRRRPPPTAPKRPPVRETLASVPKPRPKSQLEIATDAVQDAYLRQDPEAARRALLQWSKSLWPDDAPSDLNVLAQRCPEWIGKEVLRLERALYSPEPESWYEPPLWEMLSQVPGEIESPPPRERSAS